ncbi:substrate-binding domain-containing protein [Roseovarius sp.]|uniref:substrate-binding domain-containing protein n=1 Tax=Roseovarius sp. TaxID=1486281 RepID=UPI003564D1B7
MIMKRSLLAAASAAALLAATLGSAQAQDDDEITILISPLTLAFPHFVFMVDEMRDEAAMLGNVTVTVSDGQLSTTKQLTDIETAIIQGVDGIILAPVDAAGLADPVRQAIAAGIPVVTVDRPVTGVPEVLANIAADNYTGARNQGEQIARDFPDGARIVNLQGIPGDQTANDRNAGVHDVLDALDGFEFVAEQPAGFSRDQGVSVTENVLTGLDEAPHVIVAANDDMALGAVQAVEARGLSGDIAIYGFDGSSDALRAVRDGTLAATIDQFPGEQGRMAVRVLVDHIRSGAVPESDNILLDPVAITLENLQDAERIGMIGQ